MERYGNTTGKSPIIGYETGDKSIAVAYSDGNVYLYTFKVPGKRHVQAMIRRAKAGEGLSTYISKYVRERYARKSPDRSEKNV